MTYEVRETGGIFSKKYQIFHVYKDGTATKLSIPPMSSEVANAVAIQLQVAEVGGAMMSNAGVTNPLENMVYQHVGSELVRLNLSSRVASLKSGDSVTIQFAPMYITI